MLKADLEMNTLIPGQKLISSWSAWAVSVTVISKWNLDFTKELTHQMMTLADLFPPEI